MILSYSFNYLSMRTSILMLSILFSLFLAGAGCTSATSSSTVNTSEVREIESATLTTTAYVMSKNQLMFLAPSNWSVAQKDAGGASVIEIRSISDSSLIISVERAQSFDGSAMTYADWLATKFETSATSATTVGGYTFDVYEVVTEGEDGQRVLTAEVPGAEVNHFIDITLPLTDDADMQAVVDSILFNPDEDARADAQIIR